MTAITIALDAMGGDFGVKTVVPAAISALRKLSDLQLILVGDRAVITDELEKQGAKERDRLQIHHASQVVEMDESPTVALRTKKDSSMRVALNLVKEGKAKACVSAGNTGALLATAHFVLKTIPGIDRPAIIRVLPTAQANVNVRILDLGANVESTAENLFQFAVMGSVVACAVDNITTPRIGILNIGVEQIKGNQLVKQAGQLFSTSKTFNYIGYVEGDKIFSGISDVVVCDGFVGNVALKVLEGTAKLISKIAREEFKRNWLTKLSMLLAIPVLLSLRKKIDPDRYNGASLIGLKGTVIKSHGSAKATAFMNAIIVALQEAKKDVPALIAERASSLLQLQERNIS